MTKQKKEIGIANNQLNQQSRKLKAADEELRKSKKDLSLIYDTAGEVMFQIGVEANDKFRFLSVNKAFTQSTGLKYDQIVGKTIDEVIPEPSLTQVINNYKKAIAKKKAISWEETTEYPTGKRVGEVTVSPAFNREGICTHLVGSVHDLTARKKIERELKDHQESLEERVRERTIELAQSNDALSEAKLRLQLALTAGKAGTWTLDVKSGKSWWDGHVRKLFGYKGKELDDYSKYWEKVIHSDDHKQALAAFTLAIDNAEINYESVEYRVIVKSKTLHILDQIHINRNENGKAIQITGLLFDNSEHKLHEEQLKDSEQRAKLLRRVSIAAYEAVDDLEALQVALDNIAEYTGWPVGHVYLPSPNGSGDLIPSDIWYLKYPRKLKNFKDITSITNFPPGIGLPGRVYSSKKPAWIKDVSKDDNFPRAKYVKDIGVHGAFGFPIIVDGKVEAVLEFFSLESEAPDKKLLIFMEQIGTQLGIVIKRKQSEMARLESEKLTQSIAQNIPGLIYRRKYKPGEMGQYTFISSGSTKLIGYMPLELYKDVNILKNMINDSRPDKSGKNDDIFHLNERAGNSYDEEWKITTKSGDEKWVRDLYYILEDEDGYLVSNGIFLDITDMKSIWEAQQQSEQQIQSITQNIPGLVYERIYKPGEFGTFTFISSGSKDLTGYSPDEYFADTELFSQIVKSEDYDIAYKEDSAPGDINDAEYRITTKGKKTKWVRDIWRVDKSEDGNLRSSGVLLDITEQKKSHEALQESEQQIQAITQNIPGLVYERVYKAGEMGNFTYVSSGSIQLTGFTPEEYYADANTMQNFTHPEDRQSVIQREPGSGGSYDDEWRIIAKEGGIKWVRDIYNVHKNEEGKYVSNGVLLDITNRKKIEEELLAGEQRFRAVVEDQTELIHRFLPDTTLTFVNENYVKHTGKSREELLGSKLSDSLSQQLATKFKRKISSLTVDNPVKIDETKSLDANGESRWMSWTDRAIFDEKGRLTEIQAMGRDITEQKLAEEALKKGEARYRAIVEDQTDFIVRFLPDTTRIYVNENFQKRMGKNMEDLLGTKTLDEIPKNEKTRLKKKLSSLSLENPALTDEFNYTDSKGISRWESWTDRAIFNEFGKVVEIQSIGRDITDRKLAQKSLEESEKREHLLQEIASGANQAESIKEAYQITLDKIAKFTGWPIGHVYECNERGDKLISSGIWHLKHPRKFKTFKLASNTIDFAPGIGMPGDVLASKKPVWVEKLSPQKKYPRAKVGKQIGVYSALGIPVKIDGRIAAILEFFAPLIEQPDKDFLNLMDQIGNTVGSVIARKKIEGALRASEEQIRATVANIPDGIIVSDENGIIQSCNLGAENIFGFKGNEVIGKNVSILAARKDRKNHHQYISDYLRTGTKKIIGIGREVEGMRKDGSIFPMSIAVGEYKVGGKKFFTSVIQDITERKETEIALKESEQQIALALKGANAGFWDYNPKEEKVFRDTGWWSMLGYKADEFSQDSKIWELLTHPEDKEKFFNNQQKYIHETKKGPYYQEYRMKAKDGIWRWIQSQGEAVEWDDNGDVSRISGVNIDITDRKQAEEALSASKNQLDLALKGANAGYWDYNPRENSVFRDSGWWSMLGYDPDEFSHDSKVWDLLIHPDDKEKAFANKEKYVHKTKRGPLFQEYRLKAKDGTWRWIQARGEAGAWDENGEVTRISGVNIDITDRIQAEQDLLELMRIAENATQAKGDFLANMSHEIRTPMNAITSLTYLAQQTELTDQQADYLSKIQSSAHNLLGLINDILDFSKIEAGKLDMEEIDLNLEGVLSDVANVIAIPAQEKGLELIFDTQLDIPTKLIGDPLRLRQVLTNLLSNAVKFTEKGELIVTTKLLSKHEDKVDLKFSVRDTGIGLNKEQISLLFRAFSQADSSITRQYGGTGLGLAISKQIVELMDGEIGVTSKVGEGSIFTFTASFKIAEQHEEVKLIPSPDLKGMRVLVVDDNAPARKVLGSYLKSMKFRVSSSDSGASAIKKLVNASKDDPFDLVLMDWKMPEVNGLEASKQIQENPNIAKTPVIIMVTAYGLNDVMKKAKEIGLKGFLVKPVTQSLLFDNIIQAFGKKVKGSENKTRTERLTSTDLSGIQGAHVLLVEDNEINQQVAKEILESAGLIVDIAENGHLAVDAVSKFEYDVVLMDINMPIMDGYEATQKIRENEKFNELRIIAMTAQALAGDRENALKAGMNDHLTKPIDPELLFSTLLKWIEPKERKMPEEKKDEGAEEHKDEPINIPNMEGIDIENGLARIGGNKTLFVKLLRGFHKDIPNHRKDLQKALTEKDKKEISVIAHTVKGVAGNLGILELQEKSKNLELKAKTDENIEAELRDFESELAKTEKSLKVLENNDRRKKRDVSNLPKASGKEVQVLIKDLQTALKKNSPKASQAALDEILKYSWTDETAAQIESIEQMIDDFDFGEALTELGKIES